YIYYGYYTITTIESIAYYNRYIYCNNYTYCSYFINYDYCTYYSKKLQPSNKRLQLYNPIKPITVGNLIRESYLVQRFILRETSDSEKAKFNSENHMIFHWFPSGS
ncbi:hypothetical protein C2G38_1994647, partial [Gigaspora rosea]